jgi:hypothetical protein
MTCPPFRSVVALLVAALVGATACSRVDEAADPPVSPAPPSSTSIAPTTTTTEPTTTTTATAVVAVGDEVAGHFLQTVADAGLRRWELDRVSFGWRGAPTAIDRRVLEDTLDVLRSVDGLPELVVMGDDQPADVPIHVVAPEAWADALGDLYGDVHTEDVGGLAGTRSVDGRLEAAAIVVDATAEQTRRSRTIVHELFHALGVGHHDCATGIVYGGEDATPGWAVPDLDLAVVSLTYDRRLPAGLDADELAERLDRRAGEGPRCDPPTFRTVLGPGGLVLWCSTAPTPAQPCQRAADNASGGPVPGAPTVSWLSGDSLSDYDPTRFQAFSLDGQRILCELPGGGGRAPCQVTDGAVVERADWWTDGEYLYDSP